MTRHILVIDAGTTSTRALLFSETGAQLALERRDITQYYPQNGWVEHDADDIWQASLAVAKEVMAKAGGADNIAAIGITNQRETIIAWHRKTGKPLGRAIVWQDRRSAEICAALKADGQESWIQKRTGLLLDPYFSGSKIQWMIENRPEVKQAGDDLMLGTVESWLVWKLTGGRNHITDASNASRTMLMALDQAEWDEELCATFHVPHAALAEIVDNCGDLAICDADIVGAAIPITGLVGDQQGALIGQACLAKGQSKATFGTGAFILTQYGRDIPESRHKLLATVSHQIAGERFYALEGSIFVAGSLIKWLRDDVGLLNSAEESEDLAKSVDDNGGVAIVPALSGLGAPHWQPQARGLICGLSFASHRAHIARAALESMAHQCHDLAHAFAEDGAAWQYLRVDGGMVDNGWMVQDLANILKINTERPHHIESTALGAAILAATGAGLYGSLEEAAENMRPPHDVFTPQMADDEREKRLALWQKARKSCLEMG